MALSGHATSSVKPSSNQKSLITLRASHGFTLNAILFNTEKNREKNNGKTILAGCLAQQPNWV